MSAPTIVRNVFPAIVHDPRAQWLMRRREMITASDTAAILNCDPYGRKPADVFLDKTGQTTEADGWPLFYGNAFQDGVGRAFAHHTGRKVRMASLEVPEITVHSDIPWLGATLDGEQDGCEQTPAPAEGPGVLEAKVSSVAHTWDADEVPVGFQLQATTQMACAGRAWGSVVAFTSLRQPPRYQDIAFDAELFALLLRPLEEFLWRVRHKEPPLDDVDWWSTEAIRQIWAKNTGETIVLDEEAAETVKKWREIKEARKTAEETEEGLGNRIRLKLAGAAVGLLPAGHERGGVALSNVSEGWVAAHKRAAHTRLLDKQPKGAK